LTSTFFGVNPALFALDFVAFFSLYLAISLSLNLEFGFTGISNFGKVMFVAAGASVGGAFAGRFAAWIFNIDTRGDFIRYNSIIVFQATAILSKSIELSMGFLLLSIVVAAAAGALFGFLFSFPAIRLKEDFLAMALLAMAQLFQVFLIDYAPLVGGNVGVELPDPYAWAGDSRFIVATGALAIFAVLVYVHSERIAHAPLARTLRAIRDNEASAEALGKDHVQIRRKTLMTASAISSIAGLLYAYYTVDVLPTAFGRVEWTFWPFAMVIIGGTANNLGVAIGTFVFWFLIKTTDSVKYLFASYIPFDVVWLEYLLVSMLIIIILFIRPEGMLKEKPTPTFPISRLRAIFTKPIRETEEDQ
jgi:branched-chain amino acid transport system permease protein